LSRGWRICFVLARGGGDNGIRWAAEGRNSYHKLTIKDVVNSINYIKEKYKCAWERTAIYARSAGGIPAGVVTLMGLVGISFMEHPFVDVVATMGNPALPLTAVEYGEFGNPAKVDLREVSPMDCVKCISPAWVAPDCFACHATPIKTRVLLRTGERDTQVYPYEPLKFAERSRHLGHEVVLASEEREGHFYGGEAWLKTRAKDLVLLDSWASGEKISRRDIKMAKTHRNKTARRNKNKNSMRNKNKSKNMEGGKRKSRKASRRTRRRVGRKH
jgi:protease II